MSAPTTERKQKVVWKPIPNLPCRGCRGKSLKQIKNCSKCGGTGVGVPSSQAHALACDANIILFHGPRGNGKTLAQIVKFYLNVGRGYGVHHRGLILDLDTKALDDIVKQAEEFFNLFEDGVKFLRSKGDYRFKWPSGEELLFRTIKTESDYQKLHGHSYSYIGINEVTKHPTRDIYDLLGSVNRHGFVPEMTPKVKIGKEFVYNTPDRKPLPPLKLVMFLTTNPSGPGHNWVKEEFIEGKLQGKIYRTEKQIYDPLKNETRTVVLSQTHFHGNFYENPFISDEYRLKIQKLTENDPNLKLAWEYGSWDISAGGALDDIWRRDIHEIQRFPIPENWIVDRSMDWGSNQPYGIIFWAEANGEEVELLNGTKWCPPRGTLFAIAELYGAENHTTNVGNKRSVKDVSSDIEFVQETLRREKWIASPVLPGPTGVDVIRKSASEQSNVAALFSEYGIHWTTADMSPGSRINGLIAVRERICNASRGEGPGLYFFTNCINSIKTIRPIPRDEVKTEDVNTKAIDHLYDAMRYEVYDKDNGQITNLEVKGVW